MATRRCEEWQEAILDRLVNELPEGEAILLEQHLIECDDCSRQEESLRALIDATGRSEAFSAGRGLEENLLRRIRSGEVAGEGRARGATSRERGTAWDRIARIVLRPIPAYLTLALLMASCLVGAWVEGRRAGGGSSSATQQPSASAPAAPAARPAPFERPREGKAPRNGGFAVTPSDALCLVGVLGSDTL